MPVFILMFIFAGCVSAAQEYQPHVEQLRTFFARNFSEKVIYVKVPRGLVISFDEGVFFDEGSVELKEGSSEVLDEIIGLLKEIPNDVVVEDHTDGGNWEVSTERAGVIADYMVKRMQRDRVFALGYWNMMPLKGDISKRVDFVIIQYDMVR